jgi:hypothetical protein
MADSREWQTAYEAAVLEVDNSKLMEKANEAEAAIFHRLLELSGSHDHLVERDALQHAITGLGLLRNERLGYTDQA